MGNGWRIKLLGELRAESGDRVISRFYTQKMGALLAYLAYHGRRAHPREALIDLLWPEDVSQTRAPSICAATPRAMKARTGSSRSPWRSCVLPSIVHPSLSSVAARS